MKTNSKLTRRDFLKVSAIGAAGVAGTVLVPGALSAAPASAKKTAASDTVTMGFIGLGQQATYLLNGFLKLPGTRVVAGCDVFSVKRERFDKTVKDYYASVSQKVDVKTYERYQDLLAREDIDAVVIAVPDFSHAYIAIAACRAGKDVYLEKPLTYTIYEGQQLCKAVRENDRILQVGSQQRSSWEFIHAANLVRDGKLGRVSFVRVQVGGPPKPYDLPQQELPAGLNWDLWLGPLATRIHYNERLCQTVSIDPPVRERGWGAWRDFKETGGGFTTDWGAHMFDIAQWCIGKDGSGPVMIIPPGAENAGGLTYVYDNGITMVQDKLPNNDNGVAIFGENGWIQVHRGKFFCSDPAFEPAADARRVDAGLAYETNIPHQAAFIESVRSRIDPNCPVEVGHSTCTVCNLGNIAYELKRPLKWNPITQKFVNDPEASKHLSYQYYDGYTL